MTAKAASPLLLELIRRLKALRERRRLTLQQVYEATGVHIGRIEANSLNVTITTLATLCRYYQVTLSEILEQIEVSLEA
ncbi:hypothetical protein PK28_02325 [Hymenobacter sp. DG25B]|uniref:helix-turn-helix domain-containing protein n=1 Tax=Hymenobacter sp. DG25B TaxID=1385664 RepID=UPI0005412E46|nr:helix-turn-helix transcriptional regulator [Hymenobacter sp. DG25B]AIZ62807.1 hypothetical protein PK28_02325 [Hymenobacter sp. DG25B]